MVNLLAVKMIVLIIVTNCYIVDFQYALFVSSHWDCLFLSYCGTLMHINSLQHIIAQGFVQIQQHPPGYMVLLLFSWDPQGAYKEQGFLYIIIELVLCTIASVNYTLVLTIWEITQKEPWVFEIFLSMFISTWIVDISHWRVNVSCPKNWFPSHFLYKPDSCFCFFFFHVALFLIRSWTFDDFGTVLLKRLRT